MTFLPVIKVQNVGRTEPTLQLLVDAHSSPSHQGTKNVDL